MFIVFNHATIAFRKSKSAFEIYCSVCELLVVTTSVNLVDYYASHNSDTKQFYQNLKSVIFYCSHFPANNS